MSFIPGSSEQSERYSATPPPIPLRNPRHVSPPLPDQGLYEPTAADVRHTNDSSSQAAKTAVEEIGRENGDMQEKRRGALYINEDGGVRLWQTDHNFVAPENIFKRRPSEVKRSSLLWSDDGEVSRVNTSSSFTEGLRRLSASLGLARPSTLRRKEDESVRKREIQDAVMQLRHGRDSLDASDTASDLDGASQTGSTAEEDARFKKWLQIGACEEPPRDADRISQSSRTAPAAVEPARSVHSVAPSLPTTVNRRDNSSPMTRRDNSSPATPLFPSPASPLSPLNNGRDMYGNLIPTNIQDYLTSRSPPTSPPLRPITEHSNESISASAPSLRGGGGWWDLGLGQGGKESRKSGSSYRRTSASAMKSKTFLDAHDTPPNEPSAANRHPYAVGGYTSTKGQSAVATDHEWSDEESDHASIDTDGRRQSKLLLHDSSVSHEDVRAGPGPTDLSTVDTLQTPVANQNEEPPRDGFPYPVRPGVSNDAKERLDARWAGQKTLKGGSPDEEGASDVKSDLSYETRLEKRWNKAPSTAPPARAAAPPPRELAQSSASSAYRKPTHNERYMYEYGHEDTSVARQVAYDEDGWDLKSLQFGESVSVASDARHGRLAPVANPPVQQISADEYKAQQLHAQAQFRGLCQEIMSRYNQEFGYIQRQLQMGVSTEHQARDAQIYLDKNRVGALQHSARKCGYVILEDESAILEAMKTVNGYHIYYDLFHTTRPASWQRLVELYRAATRPVRTPTPEKRRSESSFDRARHATGKLARFLLAVPSDPELKTYSSRAKPVKKPNGFTAPLPPVWLNPVAIAAYAEPANNQKRTVAANKDKGKEREVVPVASQGVDERDFAAAPSLLPAASIAPSRGPDSSTCHWTGTTAVPLTRVGHSAELDVRKYEASNDSARPPAHAAMTSIVSEQSAWPESDSQGNWFDAKKARLRGGGGKKDKKTKTKKQKKKGVSGWLKPLPELAGVGVERSFAAYHGLSLR